MTDVLIALAIVVGVLVVGTWFVIWRMRRAVSRWRTRLLGLREACTTPGPRRDVMRLRRTLQQELVATQEMLHTAPDGLVFRADAGDLLASIGGMAGELDRDLRAVEGFGDSTQQKAALARLAPQVKQLVETSYSARQTILRTAVEDRDRALENLRGRVSLQADAFTRYQQDGSELSL